MNHPLHPRFFRACLAALALFSIHSFAPRAEADNPEPTEVFATANDGTQLHWVVYTPEGPGPWPAVLVIHGGSFKGGSPTSSPESVNCGRDLAAVGFIAFSIEYRLAPNGGLPGQVSSGHFPDQSDDVRLAVLAARHDSRCNGQVGSVGGSAGGYQTAFMAGTGEIGEDRIDVGVSLSGAYDLSDFTPDPGIEKFEENVINYVGSSEIDSLQAASPVYLIDGGTTPLLLINTEQDPMPFSQLADMTTTLDALGVTNYQTITLPGSAHSFSYWPSVKDRSIAFLAATFAGVPPPPPGPTPEPSASPTPPPAKAPAPSKMLLNVSTRVHVENGNGVMIGGFIVSGDKGKKVILRAIGPSLADAGVTDVLTDPVLELYNSAGTLVAQNDNCSSLAPDRFAAGFKPSDGHESYISATLPQGSYTAVLRGADGSSGIGLFELYRSRSGQLSDR